MEDIVYTTEDLKIPDRPAVEQSGDFFMRGVVNQATADDLIMAMYRFAKGRLRKSPLPKMTLFISSGGGVVESALDIYGAIMRIRHEWGYRVDTVVHGFAGSAACTLTQAGERRLIAPHAQMLVHDVRGVVGGSYSEMFSDRKALFDNARTAMAEIMAENNTAGHIDPQWWIDNYFDRDHFIDARNALSLGIVDEILPRYPRATEVN